MCPAPGLSKSALVIEPHSAFKYSNLGFALLGEVVARVYGRPFTEYLRSEILDPLGMTASCFTLEEAGSRIATGYLPHPYDDVPEPALATTDHHGYAAAAGLRSSVSDLAKWISLQFRTKAEKREGAQVLAGKSLSVQRADEIGNLAPLPEPVVTPPHLKPLLGRYEEQNFGGLFHIEYRGGALMLSIPPKPLWPPPPPPPRLLATDRDLVFTMETGRGAGEPVTFMRSDDGAITELRFIDMIYRKVS